MCLAFQVQDYGCALKMDDGEHILEMQYKLYSIFLLLDGPQSREYQKALCVSVHLWEWMKRNNHPGWQIFKNNASVFNEESGEICFSVLAREIAGSGVRSDCEAVSRKFGLIKSKMDVGKELEVEMCGEDFSSNHHGKVLTTSDDVQASIQFFKRMIRQVLNGTHRHYDQTCGVLDQKMRRRQESRKTVAMCMVPAMKLMPHQLETPVVLKIKESLRAYWVFDHRDIWPGAQPPLPDGDESDLSGAGDEEQQQEKKQGRRKRRRSPSPPQPPPLDDDKKEESWIGRLVAVPAWCFGKRWSDEAFGSKTAAKRARLHGRIEESKRNGVLDCRMVKQDDYVLQLTFEQVEKFLVPESEEEDAQDTPYVTGYDEDAA